MAAIVTFDLGTTYFKTCLFDEDGQLRALHRQAPPITHPHEGWWELDPGEFRQTIVDSVAAIKAQRGSLDDVAGVSFATQTNSFVLLDSADRPLTPIILWPDARASEFAPQMQSRASAPDFSAKTGLPTLGTEWMLAKLLWLKAHEPRAWQQCHRVCLLSDYLSLLLTGVHATEAGAAGLTGAVDIHELTWTDLREKSLPRILRAGSDLGRLPPRGADAFGLPASCRFVVGCLDQYAGAIGAGNVRPGGISETTGTVLSTVRCADHFVMDAPPDVFQGPAFDPGLYFHMCFGNTSANLLERYRSELPDAPDFAVLDAEAARVPAGCEGLRAIPAMESGRPSVRFEGPAALGRAHQARAIMEAVAFALDVQVNRLCGGDRPPVIRSSGGAARSDVWLQIKADVLGIPFTTGACPEPTSLGAAMLAGRALGWGSLDDLSQKWIRTRTTCTPDAGRHRIYRELT